MAEKGTVETVIGPETRVAGDLRGEEDLRVRGRVEGKVHLTQTLTIDDGGIVQADVDVRTLVVSGVLVGSITASESVRLTSKARVVGDITAPRFVMDAGAAYRGRVDMGDGAAAARGEKRAGAERAAATDRARPAPPRLAPPASAAASNTLRAPAAPARVATANVPRSAPHIPLMPRADSAVSAAPSWAKKKLKRR